MLKFELNIADRKTLANRMEELTGIHPYYTRAPLYAYDIGNYTIDRDGNLLVEPENADAELLTTLLNEGLIRGGESIESTDDQPENTEPTENLTAEPVTEEEPDDTAEVVQQRMSRMQRNRKAKSSRKQKTSRKKCRWIWNLLSPPASITE